MRVLQDIKLPTPLREAVILWEIPLADGETQENVVHGRMRDHVANPDNSVEAVRVIDDETGDVLYQWTVLEETLAASERAKRGFRNA